MSQRYEKYVVWDGIDENEYVEDLEFHDCMVTSDEKLISVQKLRQYVIKRGINPTVIFSCRSGETSTEMFLDGKSRGVFTYHLVKVLENKEITFREIIRLVNKKMKDSGISQTSEIICRPDILDTRFDENPKGQAHCIMIFDMCRTCDE